jgi:hypothetical protein
VKTLCNLAGKSLYLFADDVQVALLDRQAIADDFVIGDLNQSNAVLHEGVTARDDWSGGGFYFVSGIWERRERFEAKAAMLDWIDAFLSRFTVGIAKNEPLFWDRKDALARAYIAGTATDDEKAIIDVEAGLTGETPADLCKVIAKKGEDYSKVMALTTGLRRKTVAAIDAAEDLETIPGILAHAQAVALAEAAKLNVA